jgi:hypothetical protein
MNLNENILRIKEVMGITEAVINPKTENIINFIDEFALMGKKYDVDIIKLNDFMNNLPSDDENLSIPSDDDMRQMPMFGYVDPRTNKITIVFSNNVTHFMLQFLFFFKQILKHEGVHLGQASRRPSQTTGEYFGDVMDGKKYFENKDEIMAFANTLVSDFMVFKNPETLDDAKRIMKRYLKSGEDRMWLEIKNSVDNETLKKYLKYIYLYLEQEFEN